MTTPPKIAAALDRVKRIADQQHAHIVFSADIHREDRELLVRTNWLQKIIKGWYMLSRPDLASGDSVAWYANFWDFLRLYINKNYGVEYCLSAEISLAFHTGNTIIPQQVIVIVAKGGTLLQLPFATSILTYADPDKIPPSTVELNGLQIMSLAYALCKARPTYFRDNRDNVEIALRSVRTPEELSKIIIEHDFYNAAQRIVGAYQCLGLNDYANKIATTLTTLGMKISPINPFVKHSTFLGSGVFRSPYAARIHLLWEKHRDTIIKSFPKAPGLPKNPQTYLAMVDKVYEYDAYNSLSIEGYQVTHELIHRVRNNDWNPQCYAHDDQQRTQCFSCAWLL